MTSQVAVMNRNGIALASDSAATFGRGQKIYHAAEKLFQISAFPPVGLMLSGAAEIMDMPWETLIKTHVRATAGAGHPHLAHYAEAFLRAAAQPALFPAALQADWFRATVRRYWKEAFLDPLARELGGEARGRSPRVAAVLLRLLAREATSWRALPPLDAAEGYAEAVLETYDTDLAALEGELFAPFRLPRDFRAGFRRVVGMMYERAVIHPDEQSSLVFAGMGAEEPFPVLREYQVGSIAAGRLRHVRVGEARITRDIAAIVAPFGLTGMVDLFYRGIDPALEERLHRAIARVLAREARQGKGLGAARRRRIGAAIAQAFAAESTRAYQTPLITAVEGLPRHSLAAMAEALVNLTALKLRMSVDMAETVGGAIDVAVLSRGDGFVWVKRASALREAPASGVAIP